MQSLKVQQPPYQTSRIYQTPVVRVSPLVNTQQSDYHQKDESWLSCEELETIEKRFTDLLQETPDKRSDQRAKSCDRLTHEDEHQLKPMTPTCKLR